MKAAVIGIGSNSVRMLLAQIDGRHARKLMRDREGTRLFAGLDEQRNLSMESMRTTVNAVERMAREARDMGADAVHLFATSATRDAANSDVLADMLRSTGLELEVISGEEEAELSFRGATDGGHCGVIDIGGGSTEIVVGQDSGILAAFSCQMGAVRLHRTIDIRSHSDLAAVEQAALAILEENLREHPTLTVPDKWVGTGGTFTTLAAMVKGIRWTEKTYMHGTLITKEQASDWARTLADMPLEQRLTLPGLQPHRADIVVHGICILLAVMQRLGIDALRVSEYGNLDGYLKRRYGLEGEIAQG